MFSLQKNFTLISIHPLLPATIVLMCGIFFQSLEWSFYWAFSIFFIGICLSYFFQKLFISLLCASFLTGSALYQKNINRAHQFQYYTCNKKNDITIKITDIILSHHHFLKYRITGTLENLPGSQTVFWYCKKKPVAVVDDRVQLKNCTINTPKSDSMKQYFLKEHIAGTIISQDYIIVLHPFISFWRWLFEYRSKIVKTLQQKLSKNTFNYMSLLFFGNKEIHKYHSAHLKDIFKQWGISHYLARSGLHLIIFVIIWEAILKLIPFPYVFKQLIICLLTILYMLFSWTSLSFARSIISFFIYKYGLFFKTQIYPIHTITVITLCSLFYNPFYLFFLDFQLSFGITFLLTWVNHINTQQKLNSKTLD